MNLSVTPRMLMVAAVLGFGLALPLASAEEESQEEEILINKIGVDPETSGDKQDRSAENESLNRSFIILAGKLHETTFKVIRAETFGDPEGFDESLKKLFPLVQEIIELAEKSTDYPGIETILKHARSAAITVDRIDYAHYLKDPTQVSRSVGRLADVVMVLEKDMRTSPEKREQPEVREAEESEHE